MGAGRARAKVRNLSLPRDGDSRDWSKRRVSMSSRSGIMLENRSGSWSSLGGHSDPAPCSWRRGVAFVVGDVGSDDRSGGGRVKEALGGVIRLGALPGVCPAEGSRSARHLAHHGVGALSPN